FCGKPNPLIMRSALKLLGCHSEDAVIIGDRMDTDIVAGTEGGIDTVLVLSGVTTTEIMNSYAYHPTTVCNGVGDIVRCAKEDI
ncbi:MAG: HAD hydrolase-like protein, partial [Firmicutes bacterium]|nr:HAD hydrolase-like protein [Bacillota bacterium]